MGNESNNSYTVNSQNNFCRVFEIPIEFPSEYCFNGGHPVFFKMVDWFNPVPERYGKDRTAQITIQGLEETLLPFIAQKRYVLPGRKYLILYDFGGASVLQTGIK